MSPFQRCAVSLCENGYRIIRIDAGQKRPTYAGWQNTATAVGDIATWPHNGNIGLLCGPTPAVDIDVLDADLAVAMEAFVIGLIGDAPVRIGRAPKRLLLFRAATPFRKITSAAFDSPDGARHRVEILGDGQQFVAFGIHPDTGKPYQWVGEAGDPRTLDTFDLPVLTVELGREIVAEFEHRAEALGWVKVGRASGGGGAEDDDLDFLRPKPEMAEGELEVAMAAMAGADDYDTWVRVGAALHHQFDGSTEGLDMWHEWSSRSELYDGDEVDRKWASFGKYTGRKTTIGFILAETKEARAGFHRAAVIEEAKGTRAELTALIGETEDAEAMTRAVLEKIAVAGLSAMDEEIALKEINLRRKKLGVPVVSLTAMRKALQDIRRGKTDGGGLGLLLEKALADKVLEMAYSGGDHLIFFSEMWWCYRGGVWRRTEENIICGVVQEAVLRLESEHDEVALRLAEAIMESRGDRLSAVVNTVVATIRRIVGQDGYDDPLNLQSNHPPRVVNCTNGELWLEADGQVVFKRHKPDSRLTSQVACAFDAKAECPTWDSMVARVFQKCDQPDEVTRHFYEVMGYMLQPDRHQAAWVMFKGPGGNGKSTLLDVIRSVMGAGAVLSTSIADLSNGANTHFTDGAQGKLMLLDDDFKASALLPDDWLKKFSEAKSITANPKFGRQYNFIARCTPVILTNGWPSTVDLSEGLRRRALVFETSHVLTDAEKDPAHLRRVMESELPGVLKRLVEGLVRVFRRGQRFDVPIECVESKRRWITMSNPTARFVELVVHRTEDSADTVNCSDLYDAYRQWARYDEGHIRELGRNKFYEAMESLGLKRRNYSGIKKFIGLWIKPMEGIDDHFFD